MQTEFYKYQGTGNDFVMIDNRTNFFPKDDVKLIERFCDRRFGIGADGLILLENDTDTDFRMVYYNSDGNQSSMCGNGGRCLVAFAKDLQLIENKTVFIATDGLHHATISDDGIVSLQMKSVDTVTSTPQYVFLDTGSPHHVEMVTDLEHFNVKDTGAKIRYSDWYGKEGTNVNFVEQISENTFANSTYNRGVEDETLGVWFSWQAVPIHQRAAASVAWEGARLASRFPFGFKVSLVEYTFLLKDTAPMFAVHPLF